jgi:membrane protease YdiL (CAAX protease family)
VPLLQPLSAATLVAVVALLLSVVTLWAAEWMWLVAVACVLVSGQVAGVMHGPAALWLLAVAASAWSLLARRGSTRIVAIGVTSAFGLLLGLHLLPGFSNPIVIRDAVLASGALPYSQYVNFDKTLGAVLLLGCCGWTPIRTFGEWRTALRRAAPVLLLTVAVAMAASLVLGFLRFQPHWTPLFVVWAVVNLLTTCVSEEAFFRGFVQREVQRGLTSIASRRYADAIAVVVSAVLFGVAHIAGGWRYVALASLAGGGYALTYRLTARVEMSILTHFTLNAVHFLLFTYPALG